MAHFQLCPSVKGMDAETRDLVGHFKDEMFSLIYMNNSKILRGTGKLQKYIYSRHLCHFFCHFVPAPPCCTITLPCLSHIQTHRHMQKKKLRATARSISRSGNSHCSLLPIGLCFQEPTRATIVLSNIKKTY